MRWQSKLSAGLEISIKLPPKWRQRKLHQFEMLNCERNADNRDRAEEGKDQMRKRDPDAADEYPYYVENDRHASTRCRDTANGSAEGQETQAGQFDQLVTEWNANNGQAQGDATHEIPECDHQPASKDNPQQVSDGAHEFNNGSPPSFFGDSCMCDLVTAKEDQCLASHLRTSTEIIRFRQSPVSVEAGTTRITEIIPRICVQTLPMSINPNVFAVEFVESCRALTHSKLHLLLGHSSNSISIWNLP